MMNKRSSRLIAWVMTIIMVLNLAPISALADTVVSSVSINNYKTERRTELNLGEESSATATSGARNLHIDFSQSGDLQFPEDTSKVKMIYDLGNDNVELLETSGSNNSVSWEYDADNNQLIFSWVGAKADSFSVDLPIAPQPDDTHYVVKHVFHNYDGSSKLLILLVSF